VLRHFLNPLKCLSVSGYDVDTVNVNWCREHLTAAWCQHVNVDGQIPLVDCSADVLYGISVFTHLSESDQMHWLAEVARVTRRIAILSVHGMYSASQASWFDDDAELRKWLEYGFRDAEQPNPDISDVVDPEYYRDCAHTPEYIHRVWGQVMDIQEIIPAVFGGHQDAVICTPKAK
jgi:hypothetical protein